MAIKLQTFSANPTTGANLTAYKIYLSIEQISKDINANTSQVRFHSWMVFTPGGAPTYNNYDGVNNYWLKVAGTTVLSGTRRVDFRNSTYTVEIGDITRTIAHDADGSKTISAEAYQYIDDVSAWRYAQVSGSLALEAIPRATQPNMSASSATMGSSISINTPRASTSFTHKLYYKYGSQTSWTLIASDVATSYAWTIPNLASLVPNNTSATCIIACDTYSGTTLVGQKTTTFTLNVPTSYVPTATTPSLSARNALSGKYVQNKSQVKVTGGGSGIYGSTIKSIIITLKSGSNTIGSGASPYTSGVLGYSGSISVTSVVTDSRGRTATDSASFSVVAYEAPKITSFSAIRCNSDGTANISGAYMKITGVGSISPVENANSKSTKIEYKATSSSTWTASTTDTTNYAATITAIIAADTGTKYDVRLTVSDYYTSAVQTLLVPTINVPMSMFNSGQGVAFGKVAEYSKVLETASGWGVGVGGWTSGDTEGTGLQVTGTSHFKNAVYMDQVIDVTGAATLRSSLYVSGSATINGQGIFNGLVVAKAGFAPIDIASNTDLNTITSIGFYRCGTNATVATLTNCPTAQAFTLLVLNHAGYYQELTTYSTTQPRKWIRNYYGGTWSPWMEVVYEIQRGGDVNNGYVKYSNGEMEQWKTVDFTGTAINQALGSGYWSGSLSFGTWSVAFATIVSAPYYGVQSGTPDISVAGGNVTTTNAGNVYVSSVRTSTPGSLKLSIKAHGTW